MRVGPYLRPGGLLLLFGFLTQGCSGGGDPDRAVRITSLPGGMVVVENPILPEGDTIYSFRSVEDLRIGSVASGGPDQFSRIGAFTVDDEGNMYIVDGMAEEIRLFDPQGNHLRSFGRKGGGPGEFNNVTGMAWGPEGNLWTYESRKFSTFTRDGEFLRSHRRELGGIFSPWPGKFFEDGWLWDLAPDRPEAVGNDLGRVTRMMVRRTTADFSRFDTLTSYDFREERSLPSGRRRPYADRLTRFLDPAGFFLVASTREDHIYKLTPQWDTIRAFTIPVRPVEVSGFEQDSILQIYNRPGIPGRLERGDIHETKTLIRKIRMDHQGRTIVFPITSREDQNKVFLVFDPEGIYLGGWRSENRFYQSPAPQFYGDFLYGVVTDELDVSYLVRERVHPQGGR
jgi:hypothetical protein